MISYSLKNSASFLIKGNIVFGQKKAGIEELVKEKYLQVGKAVGGLQ
jgi:hypothetical protein